MVYGDRLEPSILRGRLFLRRPVREPPYWGHASLRCCNLGRGVSLGYLQQDRQGRTILQVVEGQDGMGQHRRGATNLNLICWEIMQESPMTEMG